jgi:hypothetical protein
MKGKTSLKVSSICKTFYATSIRFQPFFFFLLWADTKLNLNSKSCRQSKHSVRHTWPKVLQHLDRCGRISSPLPSIQLNTLYCTMVTKLNLEVVYSIIFKKINFFSFELFFGVIILFWYTNIKNKFFKK